MPPGSTQYTLVGFSPELDWRPLTFVKPIPANRVCSACGLVRRRTALLPCMHVLCEGCYQQCAEEGLHICPLDGFECHEEDDVDWKDFPPDQLLRKEVKCWNAEGGCQHVAAASMIAKHFQGKCKHHSVCCPNCSMNVLCNDVCIHLKSESCGALSSPPLEPRAQSDIKNENLPLTTFRECLESQVREFKAYLEKIAADVTGHGDRLNDISHNMNTLREAIRQELATGLQNPESLKITMRELSASNLEIKQCMTLCRDEMCHLSESMNQSQVVLKDGLGTVNAANEKDFLQISAAMEELKREGRENGEKTLDGITKVLRIIRLRIMQCEFCVPDIKSIQGKALKEGYFSYYHDQIYLHGYCVSPGISFRKSVGSFALHVCLQLHKGDMDDLVLWPFDYKIKLSVVSRKTGTLCSTERRPLSLARNFQKPENASNAAVCFAEKSFDLQDLLNDGFVHDDRLRVIWELLPRV